MLQKGCLFLRKVQDTDIRRQCAAVAKVRTTSGGRLSESSTKYWKTFSYCSWWRMPEAWNMVLRVLCVAKKLTCSFQGQEKRIDLDYQVRGTICETWKNKLTEPALLLRQRSRERVSKLRIREKARDTFAFPRQRKSKRGVCFKDQER